MTTATTGIGSGATNNVYVSNPKTQDRGKKITAFALGIIAGTTVGVAVTAVTLHPEIGFIAGAVTGVLVGIVAFNVLKGLGNAFSGRGSSHHSPSVVVVNAGQHSSPPRRSWWGGGGRSAPVPPHARNATGDQGGAAFRHAPVPVFIPSTAPHHRTTTTVSAPGVDASGRYTTADSAAAPAPRFSSVSPPRRGGGDIHVVTGPAARPASSPPSRGGGDIHVRTGHTATPSPAARPAAPAERPVVVDQTGRVATGDARPRVHP
jgi:hypothetical protein